MFFWHFFGLKWRMLAIFAFGAGVPGYGFFPSKSGDGKFFFSVKEPGRFLRDAQNFFTKKHPLKNVPISGHTGHAWPKSDVTRDQNREIFGHAWHHDIKKSLYLGSWHHVWPKNRDFDPFLARTRSIPGRTRDFSLFWPKNFRRALRARKKITRRVYFFAPYNPGR